MALEMDQSVSSVSSSKTALFSGTSKKSSFSRPFQPLSHVASSLSSSTSRPSVLSSAPSRPSTLSPTPSLPSTLSPTPSLPSTLSSTPSLPPTLLPTFEDIQSRNISFFTPNLPLQPFSSVQQYQAYQQVAMNSLIRHTIYQSLAQ